MSYWYSFDCNYPDKPEDGFHISPPASPELISKYSEDSPDREGYWVITEDGQHIIQQENCGGNNSYVSDELQSICDDLGQQGCVVNGVSAYCGEEIVGSICGVVEIKDNQVIDHEYGELSELLKKIWKDGKNS